MRYGISLIAQATEMLESIQDRRITGIIAQRIDGLAHEAMRAAIAYAAEITRDQVILMQAWECQGKSNVYQKTRSTHAIIASER